MGGANQSTVAPPAKASQQVNDIRVHVNNGEVHFHDDKAGKKVAVPVDQYFKQWEELNTGCAVEMRDIKNKTKVRLSWVENGNELDVEMTVDDFNPVFGPGYKALEKLTQ